MQRTSLACRLSRAEKDLAPAGLTLKFKASELIIMKQETHMHLAALLLSCLADLVG